MLLAGRHFFPHDPPEAIAHKILATNISDIAAMGGQPRWVLLSAALPELNEAWLQAFSGSLFAHRRRQGFGRIKIRQAAFIHAKTVYQTACRTVNGKNAGMESLIGTDGDVFRGAATIFAGNGHLCRKFGKTGGNGGGIDGYALVEPAINKSIAAAAQGVAAETAPD